MTGSSLVAAIQLLALFFQPANIDPPPYIENRTYTYSELIEVYSKLDEKHTQARLLEIGQSDIGKPIHLFVISKDQLFDAQKAIASDKRIIMINNGIHPGEACGIDASVELAKKLLNPNHPLNNTLDSVIVLIIPTYNVGGMLNRGSFSRANQNGPKEYGFRGNAKNLDLNRDFIKADSENAKTFNKVFSKWDPDIFIDTHTTNGSDHQYTMTLIATQKDKVNPLLSKYMTGNMLPEFYSSMKEKNKEMTPYVYSFDAHPENGIKDFMETARYSSGYAALFDCFSFITEAHVFKPFKDRVEHTLAFLESTIEFTAANNTSIKQIRKKAKKYTINQSEFALDWQIDSSQFDHTLFKGYETQNKKSDLTGNEMTFYNTQAPYEKKIKYYNSFKPSKLVNKPRFYLIPQAYKQVIQRLDWNGVEMNELKSDSLIKVEISYISNYETLPRAYEGHYLHSEIEVERKVEEIQFRKGDFLISTNQKKNRYILETLEAESVDGFFAWNFFDGILQQKEWFSDYAFEPKAKIILQENEMLKKEFLEKRQTDSSFASNNFAQLYYIYKRSPYYEKTVNRFPIYRVN